MQRTIAFMPAQQGQLLEAGYRFGRVSTIKLVDMDGDDYGGHYGIHRIQEGDILVYQVYRRMGVILDTLGHVFVERATGLYQVVISGGKQHPPGMNVVFNILCISEDKAHEKANHQEVPSNA